MCDARANKNDRESDREKERKRDFVDGFIHGWKFLVLENAKCIVQLCECIHTSTTMCIDLKVDRETTAKAKKREKRFE